MTDVIDGTTNFPTIYETWGRRVTTRRLALDMRQEELAAAAGTSQQTISRIELGRQVASDALRMKVAKALGCKAGDLFAYDDEGE